MNIKNLQYNAYNTINCVIEHPVFGWIPFTADPNDTEASGREIHQEIIEGLHGAIAAYIAPPPPIFTKEELAIKLNKSVQSYIYTKYDAGTQASLLAIYSDGRTPAQAKAAAEVVWDWIRAVMVYYYTCKAEILESARTEWDFSQFNATDPGLSLADFM